MSAWLNPAPFGWADIVEDALREDIGTGDLTSAILSPDERVEWYIEAQGPGVVCGLGIVEYLFEPSSEDDELEIVIHDGADVAFGTIVARGKHSAADALQYERTALNFLMHMSGVATSTSKFVDSVKHTKARIADTRKTLPGLRLLQKYAVRCGGGFNHRMGLYDAVMIKDNHIQAHGTIAKAVEATRKGLGHMIKVEIECESKAQVEQAIQSQCDVIMLDNMPPNAMAQIVQEFSGKAIFEASGGVDLSTVRQIAETGVDVISVGAITHSVISVPFHLELR